MKRKDERPGMEEVHNQSVKLLIFWATFFYNVPSNISFEYSLPYLSESVETVQMLGERVEFEVLRAGPSFPIRGWPGQEAVYR